MNCWLNHHSNRNQYHPSNRAELKKNPINNINSHNNVNDVHTNNRSECGIELVAKIEI